MFTLSLYPNWSSYKSIYTCVFVYTPMECILVPSVDLVWGSFLWLKGEPKAMMLLTWLKTKSSLECRRQQLRAEELQQLP